MRVALPTYRRRVARLGASIVAAAMLLGATPEGVLLAVRHELVVKVPTPSAAADALVAEAEKLGGYFAARDDVSVSLKVPTAATDNLLTVVAGLGTVVSRQRQSRDLGPTLAEWETLLKSRREVLRRYFAVIGSAEAAAVVQVEREMTSLVEEIERLEGQIRLAEHQLSYANIVVRFEFRDRRPPARDGSSSFVWINSVNLADLLGEFGHD